MSHTFTNILIHVLFSTKDRQPWLTPEIREEVFRYLGGTLNQLRGHSLLVNEALHRESGKASSQSNISRRTSCVSEETRD
jgi:hypothetical protein